MPQKKKIIQLAISAVLALGFINFYLKQKEQVIEDAYGMVEVLTAAQDIPPYTQLRPEFLTTQKVPLKFMSPGAFIVKIPSETYARINGKVTVAAVPAGTQISQAILTEPSMEKTGVAPLIPPGKRGYLLRLGNLDVAKLILPGNHIDVMATLNVRRGNNGETSKATYTILQNILVVSVGKVLQETNRAMTGKKESEEGLVLTLALEPQEAEKLALAQEESQGAISVVVRPHGDSDVKSLSGTNPNSFLDGPGSNQAGRFPAAN